MAVVAERLEIAAVMSSSESERRDMVYGYSRLSLTTTAYRLGNEHVTLYVAIGVLAAVYSSCTVYTEAVSGTHLNSVIRVGGVSVSFTICCSLTKVGATGPPLPLLCFATCDLFRTDPLDQLSCFLQSTLTLFGSLALARFSMSSVIALSVDRVQPTAPLTLSNLA